MRDLFSIVLPGLGLIVFPDLGQFSKTDQFPDLKEPGISAGQVMPGQKQVCLLVGARSKPDAFAICLAIWVF